MDTKEFLTEIYKGCDEGYITLTLLPERRTLWFKLGEFDKLEQAVKKYSNKTNIYFGVGLRKRFCLIIFVARTMIYQLSRRCMLIST